MKSLRYNSNEGSEGTSSYAEINRESGVSWKPLIGSICEDHPGAVTQKIEVSVAVSLR